MTKVFLYLGAVCFAMAMVFSATGLATSNWVSACMSHDGMAVLMKKVFHGSSREMDYEIDTALNEQPCVHCGLFQSTISVSRVKVSWDFPMETLSPTTKAITTLIVIGHLFILIGAFVMMKEASTANDQSKYRTKIFAGLLLVGCTAIGTGILSYSIQRSDVVGDSRRFEAEIREGLEQALKPMMSADYGALVAAETDESYEYTFDSDVYQSNDNQNVDTVLTGNDESLGFYEKIASAGFKHLNPVFGFSYYLVCTGFLLALLSVFFFGLAYLRARKVRTRRPRLKPRIILCACKKSSLMADAFPVLRDKP